MDLFFTVHVCDDVYVEFKIIPDFLMLENGFTTPY